jgi:hypothetical protein
MFTTNREQPILMTSLVLALLIIFIPSSTGYSPISITRDVELHLTDGSITVPTVTATSGGSGNGNDNSNENGNGGETTELTDPTTARIQFIPPITTTKPPPAPSSNPPQIPTPTLSLGPLAPTPILTPTPLQPSRTIITNVNNVNINDVQNFEGSVRGTSDCAPVVATIVLGPSTMEAGGARILAAFDPCVLTDGTVLLILPDEQGIQLVAANIQAGHTTQSAIIPLQKIAPVTQEQVLFGADLSEQVTGPDQARGERVTLDGNINALFLWNNSGQAVEFVGDHNASLNTLHRR